jgi:hypothetical protein
MKNEIYSIPAVGTISQVAQNSSHFTSHFLLNAIYLSQIQFNNGIRDKNFISFRQI